MKVTKEEMKGWLEKQRSCPYRANAEWRPSQREAWKTTIDALLALVEKGNGSDYKLMWADLKNLYIPENDESLGFAESEAMFCSQLRRIMASLEKQHSKKD